ncbi:MAG: TonB C-terminal domain-containing protein [Candidatus Aminicenantes bacterium]|nr:TonB C-terminal domain-containing protein [Candidatus Aminicenantes bacterium]
MTAGWAEQSPLFKRAVVISSVLHVLLFVFVVTAPGLPVRPKKGLVQYVSFLGFPGGGGSGSGGPGGAAPKAATPPAAKKETLRDLTLASKVKPQEPPASLRYPVEKPKRDKSAPPEKKAAITRPDIGLKPPGEETSGEVQGASQGGSGVRVGLGGGGEGGGIGGGGGGFGGSGGLANFPFAWYVQVIMNRVSANWFTSLVDPGVAGTYQTVLYFRIHRDGSVTDLKVETSSGIASLDVSAQRAVQSSAPFPPLPGEYEDQFLGIHLIFEHSK